MLLKESANLTAACMAFIYEKAVPGISLQVLEAEADYLARMRGCEDLQLLAGVGGNEPGPVNDYVLQDGDFLRIILSTQILRYWTSMCRTIIVGGNKGAQGKGISAARALENELLEALNPDHFQRDKLLALAGRAEGKIGLGGSIGLELEEEADLLGEDFRPLRGMTISLRVSMETDGQRILHGDTILFNAGYTELLTEVEPS